MVLTAVRKTNAGVPLSGLQKAAILLISMGPEGSAQIFKQLSEEEMDNLTLEIASVRQVDSGMRLEILQEFYDLCVANNYIAQGGMSYARDLLQKALGNDKANEIIQRLTSHLQVRPFEFARKADPGQILNFIQHEHPQTIALVLSYLQPEQASLILSELTAKQQVDVAKRIAMMERTSPEVVSQVEQVLEQKLASTMNLDMTEAGGVQSIVQILNGVDRGTEKTIIAALELDEPELAEEIKRRMFVFEDIVNLDDRSIQRLIRDVETTDLQYALKVASEEVKEVVFRNMSTRMKEMIQEEMQYMGPVRLREVEEAQSKVVALIRRLEEMGEIVVARGGGDDLVV